MVTIELFMAFVKKRIREERTLDKKWQIIQNCNDDAGIKRKDIAAHFEIKPQTLSDLLEMRM